MSRFLNFGQRLIISQAKRFAPLNSTNDRLTLSLAAPHLRCQVRHCGYNPYGGSSAYEGPGKTTVSILNNEESECLLIETYSTQGFRLNNDVFVIGPIAMFPRTILQWDVNSVADITVEALSLFWLLEPKLDVLVIGTGDEGLRIDDKVRLFMHRKGINMEVVATDRAVAAFNFMVGERRHVAAALIPPLSVKYNNIVVDMIESARASRSIYRSSQIHERKMMQQFETNHLMLEHIEKRVEMKHEQREKQRKLDMDRQSDLVLGFDRKKFFGFDSKDLEEQQRKLLEDVDADELKRFKEEADKLEADKSIDKSKSNQDQKDQKQKSE